MVAVQELISVFKALATLERFLEGSNSVQMSRIRAWSATTSVCGTETKRILLQVQDGFAKNVIRVQQIFVPDLNAEALPHQQHYIRSRFEHSKAQ